MNGKLSFWFCNIRNYLQMHMSLVAGIFGGCLGVFVDIDHPIAFLLGNQSGRFFHYPLFFIAFAVFCGLCAYIGRLLCMLVLRKIKERKCIIVD